MNQWDQQSGDAAARESVSACDKVRQNVKMVKRAKQPRHHEMTQNQPLSHSFTVTFNEELIIFVARHWWIITIYRCKDCPWMAHPIDRLYDSCDECNGSWMVYNIHE